MRKAEKRLVEWVRAMPHGFANLRDAAFELGISKQHWPEFYRAINNIACKVPSTTTIACKQQYVRQGKSIGCPY